MRHAVTALSAAVLLACSLDAAALNQRSFVASYGLDTNPCNLANPCRSFNTAIAQTAGGGEVVILDTAGYGPMTIGKSIKVIGPAGVYGGISVVGGTGPTTGVTINAGSTDVVTLRGLDITGVPGAAPPPDIGIDIVSAGAVHIEKSSIGNFTQDTSACINLDTAVAVQLYVVDSFLRECRRGVRVNGTGLDNATRPVVEIDNTRIEHPLNTVSTGRSGVRLNGNFLANIRNSTITGALDGVHVGNNIGTAASRAYVINSKITQSSSAAIQTDGGNNASLVVNVSNSVLDFNDSAILFGHGAIRLSSNIIANNTNSIVNCGGTAGNVVSLGYGASVGSNLITDSQNAALPPGCTAFITPVLLTGQ